MRIVLLQNALNTSKRKIKHRVNVKSNLLQGNPGHHAASIIAKETPGQEYSLISITKGIHHKGSLQKTLKLITFIKLELYP